MEAALSTINSIGNLVDINDIRIDASLPIAEKRKQYLEQIKDPYHFKCGNITVHVGFAGNGISLKDRLQQYLLSGQANELNLNV